MHLLRVWEGPVSNLDLAPVCADGSLPWFFSDRYCIVTQYLLSDTHRSATDDIQDRD